MDRKHHRAARWAVAPGALLALWVAVSLPPAAARAANPTGIQSQLAAIARLYEELEYEDALSLIDQARALPHSDRESVTLFLYEGILLLEKGRNAEGETAFVSALALDPSARLPVPVAPKIQAVFNKARGRAPKATPPQPPETLPQPPETPPPEDKVPVEAALPAPPSPGPRPPAEQVTPRQYALLPAVAGGALLVVGGLCWNASRQELGRLRGGPDGYTTQEEARQGAARGRAWQSAGVGLLGAGLVGVGTAAAMYVWGGPRPPLALEIGNHGVSVSVRGEWP